MKTRVWLVILLLWLLFTVIGYTLFEFEGPQRMWLSVSFLPASILSAVIFLSLWSFIFDWLPLVFKRTIQGPPWEKPRILDPFASKQERKDLNDLLPRLKVTGKNAESRCTYYIDRYTQQKWVGHYTEQGFGSGEILIPSEDEAP